MSAPLASTGASSYASRFMRTLPFLDPSASAACHIMLRAGNLAIRQPPGAGSSAIATGTAGSASGRDIERGMR
ncbi:hypothetical protein CRG98_003875 [Punica granatum]|uniref:Uncharacterized protein n=1 Tax=Punica granatum TaxID=22663 RepID=A0A2I0L4V8_PUNGR|nr:hypothetical protein CRG98_003875 [Punica granatum]